MLIDTCPPETSFRSSLIESTGLFRTISSTESPEARIPLLKELRAKLLSLLPEWSSTNLIQADSFLDNADLRIPRTATDELLRTQQSLQKILPAFRNDLLDSFKQRFRERFEDRWVSLAEAIGFDQEHGLGLSQEDSWLTRELGRTASPSTTGRQLSQFHWHLLELISGTKEGFSARHFELEPDRFPNAAHDGDLPESFSLSATLFASGANAVGHEGLVAYLRGGYAASGMQPLGRFTDGAVDVQEIVSGHLLKQERLHPDMIFAEIDLLPEGRVANIVVRPSLRTHRIVISSVIPPREGEIGTDELSIRVGPGKRLSSTALV